MYLMRIWTIIAVGTIATILVLGGCAEEKAKQQVAPSQDTHLATRSPDSPPRATGDTGGEHIRDSQPVGLPRLVDLGKGTCIPCKKMAPILEELRKEYEDRAAVEVIDLRDDPGAAVEYGIRLIPTQIFFDDEGKEVWRHEGFLAKGAIIAKFEEMGVKPVDN